MEKTGGSDKLLIFDTTLRDGEQCPGAAMVPEKKLAVAKQLERLKVDVIEAGFPAASEGDAAAVRTIAEAVDQSVVCGLARAAEKDIRIAAKALRPARRGRIHTFIATSPVHMRKKLGMEPDTVLAAAADAVALARSLAEDVEFSPEDAGRSDVDFLCRVVEAAITAGARTINIPDTVGYTLPDQFAHLVRSLMERVPNSDLAVFSVHCHDDLGLAVANSLAAVAAGARQVECTINGIGERAGNASLEEIVMAVRTRRDAFGCDTGVNASQLVGASRMVSAATGFVVQPNKAIVGANAFAHAAGIHQDGMFKDKGTYEIMRPQDVGWLDSDFPLTKHSGRSAVRNRLAKLGIKLEPGDLDAAFARFKKLADKKKEIFDEDLVSVANNFGRKERRTYKLKSWQFKSVRNKRPRATVGISRRGGKPAVKSASGDGMVDASFKAVEKIVRSGAVLDLYSVLNITDGSDAQGQVTVRLKKNGHVASGQGADTDIIVASVKAYLDAVNKAEIAETAKRENTQAV